MTDAQMARELMALRQRVAALEDRTASNRTRLSQTLGGVTEPRPIQLGFPAETTGAYNATTGYPWKRLTLDVTVPAFSAPTPQETGDYAFEVGGSTTLASGTKVWLEPSPEASGYVLYCGGNGSVLGGYLLLCEVTVSSSTTHTVKRKTRNGSNLIVDYSPATTYTQCLSTTAGALPVGTIVLLDPIPDASGYYWITPAGYATSAYPGLVSLTTQEMGAGWKKFNYALENVDAPVFTVYGAFSSARTPVIEVVQQVGLSAAYVNIFSSGTPGFTNHYGGLFLDGRYNALGYVQLIVTDTATATEDATFQFEAVPTDRARFRLGPLALTTGAASGPSTAVNTLDLTDLVSGFGAQFYSGEVLSQLFSTFDTPSAPTTVLTGTSYDMTIGNWIYLFRNGIQVGRMPVPVPPPFPPVPGGGGGSFLGGAGEVPGGGSAPGGFFGAPPGQFLQPPQWSTVDDS